MILLCPFAGEKRDDNVQGIIRRVRMLSSVCSLAALKADGEAGVIGPLLQLGIKEIA